MVAQPPPGCKKNRLITEEKCWLCHISLLSCVILSYMFFYLWLLCQKPEPTTGLHVVGEWFYDTPLSGSKVE